MPTPIPARLCLALAGALALASPAAASKTFTDTISNFVSSGGGGVSSLASVTGSFTEGTTAADFVANVTAVENALGPQTYTYTGQYSPYHFSTTSNFSSAFQATLSIGSFGPGAVTNNVGVSLSDFIFGGAGTVTITRTPFRAVPEPGAWALMALGMAALGAGLRRRRDTLA
jgi:hypothetical protein